MLAIIKNYGMGFNIEIYKKNLQRLRFNKKNRLKYRKINAIRYIKRKDNIISNKENLSFSLRKQR